MPVTYQQGVKLKVKTYLTQTKLILNSIFNEFNVTEICSYYDLILRLYYECYKDATSIKLRR